jgi:hypothetical protein
MHYEHLGQAAVEKKRLAQEQADLRRAAGGGGGGGGGGAAKFPIVPVAIGVAVLAAVLLLKGKKK